MAVLRLLALGEEADPLLWLYQALVTCHTLRLRAGFLLAKVSLQAKVSLLDQAAQVLGVMRSPQVLVVPQSLKLVKANEHLRTLHQLKIRRNRLPLDSVQTNPRVRPQQSLKPNPYDSPPTRQLLQ